MKKISFLLVLFLPLLHACSVKTGIFMDGNCADWDAIKTVYTDPEGDPGIDILSLKISNDQENIYFQIRVKEEFNLQNDNHLCMYFDLDNDANTGERISGMGADLIWELGSRSGSYLGEKIYHSQIAFVSAPTVTSSVFEMAIKKNTAADEEKLLFNEKSFHLLIKDNKGGDIIPDAPGGIEYTLQDFHFQPEKILIKKEKDDLIRVMAYNVLRDNIFKDENKEAFSRIIHALEPEIMGFTEIYKHSPHETEKLIRELYKKEDNTWYSAGVDPDIVLISRYPVLKQHKISLEEEKGGNGAFLLDLNPQYKSQLLVIVAHPPCCAKNKERQMEIDAIMAFLRDAKAGKGPIPLEKNTPFVIMGDMNLVGYNQQLHTFLEGQIINEDIFGANFKPDWNGSPLSDLNPRHNESNMHFSWYDTKSTFWPGRLDFIFYSKSVIDVQKGFVLFTPELSTQTLEEYKLQNNDCIESSDHLPVIMDFKPLEKK
jgi:endonuclease/exonuclease/phosphatase family metal-dependent hydrolase